MEKKSRKISLDSIEPNLGIEAFDLNTIGEQRKSKDPEIERWWYIDAVG